MISSLKSGAASRHQANPSRGVFEGRVLRPPKAPCSQHRPQTPPPFALQVVPSVCCCCGQKGIQHVITTPTVALVSSSAETCFCSPCFSTPVRAEHGDQGHLPRAEAPPGVGLQLPPRHHRHRALGAVSSKCQARKALHAGLHRVPVPSDRRLHDGGAFWGILRVRWQQDRVVIFVSTRARAGGRASYSKLRMFLSIRVPHVACLL